MYDGFRIRGLSACEVHPLASLHTVSPAPFPRISSSLAAAVNIWHAWSVDGPLSLEGVMMTVLSLLLGDLFPTQNARRDGNRCTIFTFCEISQLSGDLNTSRVPLD